MAANGVSDMLALLYTITALTGGGGTHPNPPATHYRVDVSATQDVDASALGGAPSTTKFDVSGFLSLTMSDTAGGQLAHAVIDSVTLPAGTELPPGMDDPASAAGVSFHAYVVDGKVSKIPEPSSANNLAAIFSGTLGVLFPGVRANARMGDTWWDTTTTKTATSPTDTRTSTTITKWTVTAVNGSEITVQGDATGTSEGPVSTSAGELTLKGTMNGTRHVTVAPGAPASHADATATTDATLSSPTLPAAVTVKGTTTITVTRLP
jgi:hypothetical protein